MNPRLKKFKDLTTWVESNRVENLLEGTLFLNNAFKFIDLLVFLDENSFVYTVIEGFKGKTAFGEKENHFKDVVLQVSNERIENVVEFFNKSAKCNEDFKVQVIDNDLIKIEIR